MMDTKDFALAVVPPALAIFLELATPFTERYFSSQADQIVDREIGPPASGPRAAEVAQITATAKLLLAHSMEGAGSLAGLAPTLVSFIAAGIAIILVVGNPFWWLLGFIAFFVVLAILILRVLAGRTLFHLATVQLNWLGRPPVRLLSWIIYLTNGVLIAIACAIFFCNCV